MKKFCQSMAIIATMSFASSAALAAHNTEPLAAKSTQAVHSVSQPEYLYVINAPEAVVKKVNGKYILQMDQVKTVTQFTDRPFRQAKTISAQDFVTLWNSNSSDSFKNDNPNAFVEGLSTSQKAEDSQVVTMSQPVLKGQKLSFQINQLEKHHSIKVGQLKTALVFVDGLYM